VVRPIIYHMRAAQHRDRLATRGQGASAWANTIYNAWRIEDVWLDR
jgi:hypothetical protein